MSVAGLSSAIVPLPTIVLSAVLLVLLGPVIFFARLSNVLEKEVLDADVDFIAVSNILERVVPEPVYVV
jgi:hypoxanthine-guanine phosphoribosyltransferase